MLQNYIDGRFVSATGSGSLDLIDPTTEKVSAQSPISSQADIDSAVEAAQRAFRTGQDHTEVRQQALLKFADAIEAHSDELVDAQSRNTGQPKAVVAAEEVTVGADQIRFFAGAARLLEGKSAGEYMEGFTSYVRREPIGVIGQVTPWNYPLMMAIWKIGPAIAAGNTVVLKPSDTTPESTLVLARISKDIFPDGVLNVVLGNAENRCDAGVAPHGGDGLDHRIGASRNRRRRGGCSATQACAPRTRRQGSGDRVLRRRHRHGCTGNRGSVVLQRLARTAPR